MFGIDSACLIRYECMHVITTFLFDLHKASQADTDTLAKQRKTRSSRAGCLFPKPKEKGKKKKMTGEERIACSIYTVTPVQSSTMTLKNRTTSKISSSSVAYLI